MRSCCGNLRYAPLLILLWVSVDLAACGNSCFVGFSNYGTGGIIVRGGNPPPACTLRQAQGMLRIALLKNPACESCAPANQIQHNFVVLRGIHIHAQSFESDGGQWFDVAPELAAIPREFDLIGDSLPDWVTPSTILPAGTYDFARLQFSRDNASNPAHCGAGVVNCLILKDGRIAALGFASDASELVIQLTNNAKPLLVLPNTTSELHIRLHPRTRTPAWLSFGDAPPVELAGEVATEGVVHPD